MYPFTDPIEPTLRLLYKAIQPCLSDGCHMDVFLPQVETAEALPVAIFIHGGAFSQGSSKDIGFNQVEWLLEQGIACVSIEYRLAPHACLREIREDLLDAYVFVCERLQPAVQEAGHKVKLDGSRCLVTGGSAGGTSTVLMAADVERLRARRPDIPAIRATLPAFPLVDWATEDGNNAPRSKLKEQFGDKPEWATIQALFDQPVCCSDPYPEDVFHPDMSQPRLQFISAAFASKTLNSFVIGQDAPYPAECDLLDSLTPHFPPTRVFCAVKDSLIPVEHSYRLVLRLQRLGVDCEAVNVEEAEHGFTDLPMRYFPQHAQQWWDESIQPALEWAVEKLRA